MNAVVKAPPSASTSVIVRLGQRFGIDADKMLETLKATAFKGEVTNAQMVALCVVADQYGLNPWTKEIFAFSDGRGIVPVVGVDGWARIINSNPQFDGMEFNEGELNAKSIPTWIECIIHRKDRAHPVAVKEYFDEVVRDTGPWKSHPRRMLRHKAMIQCSRIAFGFAGIYDPDEAERIIDVTSGKTDPRGDLAGLDPAEIDRWVSDIKAIIAEHGSDEARLAPLLFEVHEALNTQGVLYSAVFDRLASEKIISKANWKKLTGK